MLHLDSRYQSMYPGFPCGASYKESTSSAGDPGSIPGLGRSPGEGHGNPLQYSRLENPMDRGAWRATVHRVAKSQMQLSDKTTSNSKGPQRQQAAESDLVPNPPGSRHTSTHHAAWRHPEPRYGFSEARESKAVPSRKQQLL